MIAAELVGTWQLFQQMQIRDRDPTEHRANDAQKPLIRPAEIQIAEMCASIADLVGSSVDGTIRVTGEFRNGSRREDIGINDVRSEVWHEP